MKKILTKKNEKEDNPFDIELRTGRTYVSRCSKSQSSNEVCDKNCIKKKDGIVKRTKMK